MSSGKFSDRRENPPIDWTGDPVSAIGRYCQAQGWAFIWDPVEPWVDLRFAAKLYGIGYDTVRVHYAGGINRIRTNGGIAVRMSDLNRAREQGPKGSDDSTQNRTTTNDGPGGVSG